MSKETEKYGDPQERRSLACMGTVDLITHAIKQSEAVSAQQSRIDALEKALAMARPYVDAEWPLDDDDSEEAKDARAASEEIERLLDSSALHPSDNETGGVGIK